MFLLVREMERERGNGAMIGIFIYVYYIYVYMYMDVLKKTLLLFLLVCVPLRVLFVVVAKMVSIKYLFYLGVLGLVPAFGFLFLHFYPGYRPEGAFGQKKWWNRLVHGLFYLAFAVSAMMGNRNAYLFLLIDVVYGLVGFVRYHFMNGDFRKIIKQL